ncbi:UPF0001 protein [Yarrowia sp. C11]|nr:UPF0001 protein [Yarrowia sp. E02]KAG5365269.1 UPF0001 protein [Yarrowia sp. C11]
MLKTAVRMSRVSELAHNYNHVKTAVSALSPSTRLVCVSKYKPASDIQAVYDLGQRHFGENYVQELMEKVANLPQEIQWHFIGSLQSNKCAQLAKNIPNLWVETVDGEKKAKKLNDAREQSEYKDKAPVHVFVQVNTSGESQKSGMDPEDVSKTVEYIVKECPQLKLAGLMTIGSIEQSKGSEENKDFATLVQIRDSIEQALDITGLELSMGMSSDYEEAIKQGSTNVRIGSTIFGGRMTKEEVKTQ